MKHAEEMVVAEDDEAAIYISTTVDGSNIPADATVALGAGWHEVGLVDTDGARLRLERTITDIGSWQSRFPTRRINSANTFSVAFNMQQWDELTLPFAFGGGAVTEPTSGKFRYDIPDGGTDNRAMIIQWKDGTKHYRVVVPKGNVTDPVESQLNRVSESKLPIAFAALKVPGQPLARILTDDPGFAAGS